MDKLERRQNKEALDNMNLAADMEDKTEKHPVTPGEVLPAKELLGDLLMQMKRPADALTMYEASLKKHPNRFNSLYGAAIAADRSRRKELSKNYFKQLLNITGKDFTGDAKLIAVK